MSWNCEDVEARLSEHVDERLEPAEQRAFAAHLEGCAGCRRQVAQVSGYVARIRGLEALAEPPRLVYQILDQTLGPRKATGWRAVREWLRPAAQPRFAMGTVISLLAVMVVGQALGIRWSQVKGSDLRPSALVREADRRVHRAYARGVKFVNDLRVVYEIQTRLQAPQESPPEPQPTAPGTTESAPQKREREINRADELKSIPSLLATAIGGMPGRSIR